MGVLSALEPRAVFGYFEEICAIPHGSGDMQAISDYCVAFADAHGLRAVKDDACNVIIYKNGTAGYEHSAPLMLQGHLDMVCQQTADAAVDFLTDGIVPCTDGTVVTARNTTLGADNGIAVAMILAILASDDIPHPPLEAVFTTDEEVGMIGAGKLDIRLLSAKQMVNLDAEEADYLTVSCAGGSDARITVPIVRRTVHTPTVQVDIRGLQGGHSGVEIDKGRVNATVLMGRLLAHVRAQVDAVVRVDGGSKGNAIPRDCTAVLAVSEGEAVARAIRAYADLLKAELHEREPQLDIAISVHAAADTAVMDEPSTDRLTYLLLTTPNGITEMSASIAGLVETSLNLGICQTGEDAVTMQYALRSNQSSALDALEEKMAVFAAYNGCEVVISGRYQPWEYAPHSALRERYSDAFYAVTGKRPIVAAIHAGLECAVFASGIEGLDCIAVGPDMANVHTVEETLSVASTQRIFEVLCVLLKNSR